MNILGYECSPSQHFSSAKRILPDAKVVSSVLFCVEFTVSGNIVVRLPDSAN